MNEYRRILNDLQLSRQQAKRDGDVLKLAYLNDIII